MNDAEKTKEQLIQEIKALQESEARYKGIFESAREGIFVTDVETKQFKYANPAICKMFGYPEEELRRMGVHDIHPEKYTADAISHFDAMARGEREQSRNVPCLRKDGTIFYADINTTIVTINNCLCNVGLFSDVTERKSAEEALQESEARYRAIFESAREGIIVGIMETRQFIYANPAICKMFGYTAEELTRLTVNDIHSKEHLQYASDRFKAFMRGEALFTPNMPCLHKNGTIFYADINATRIVINNKACFVGFFTDTTERKHAEEALRESEARYKAIFDYATEGIIIADIETKRFKYTNQAACEMFGYTAEQLQQMSVYDIHPKEYMPYVLARFEVLARGEKTRAPDVPCISKDGTVFYANINSTRVIIDQKPCNVGLFTNITKRKHAEDALRESEEKFRGLAERSFDTVFMTDTRGFITYLSLASERIFGYKPDEMAGKPFMNFLKESEIPKATQRFSENLEGKKFDVLYLEAKKKDGSHVFIELNSSLVMQDGSVKGTQGIIRDVTDRKKAEEELKKAHEELENRVRQRTADLARVIEELQKEIAERRRAEQSLRQAEERFRTIFENTIIGLYRTTPDGQILLANPALVKMLGYGSFDELSQVNLEKGGLDPSTPRSIFKQRIEKESRVLGLESVWLKKDGSKLFVSESAFAVKDANGNILYYEGTAQDITQRKEAEEKLLHYQKQLRSLASELSLAEERLRRKIASDLHDNISQNLAISKMKLESLIDTTNPNQAKDLGEVTNLIAQTIEVTRSLTFEMSPPVLYELGFEAAVGWLANQTRQRFGIETEFENDGRPKPLDNDIKVLLFQAVRELLANIIKHSKARKVKVTTARLPASGASSGSERQRNKSSMKSPESVEHIRIIVEDDGIGFDISNISEGFGLFNIRERLDHIGGSVEIHSRPGHGTRVTLIAPLLKPKNKKSKTGVHK